MNEFAKRSKSSSRLCIKARIRTPTTTELSIRGNTMRPERKNIYAYGKQAINHKTI